MLKRLLLSLPLMLGVFLSCNIGIAGSIGGLETTNGVAACILHTDGTPAAGSVVRLRRVHYVSQPAPLAKKSLDNTDVVTDQLGHLSLLPLIPAFILLK